MRELSISPETKGGSPMPFSTRAERSLALSISRESPSNLQLRVDSRIAGGHGIAYGNAHGGLRFSVPRSNQIPTITNLQSELVYLLGAKTGSVLLERGDARAQPPLSRRPIAIHAAVNLNCIIKI